jgi:hypothetical protein
MGELRDQCLLRITGADDDAVAIEVLTAVRKVLFEVTSREYGVAYVSEVMPTPDGPMVFFDAKGMSGAELGQVLEALVRVARDVGLTTGRIEVPPDGQLIDDLELADRAVIGAALPPPDHTQVRPPHHLPGSWRDVAAEWLRETGRDPLVAEIVAVEASLGWDQLDAYLGSEGTARGFRVSSGTMADGVRTLFQDVGGYTRQSFLATRLSMSSDEMEREADSIRRRLRSMAVDLACAYVTPANSAGQFGRGELDLPGAPNAYPGGVNRKLRHLSNIQVLDAFWYQVLGPGHLDRIGPLPGAEPIGHGKVELVLGDFRDWLDPERAKELREHGRSLLGPCFLGQDEARAILDARRAGSDRTSNGKCREGSMEELA